MSTDVDLKVKVNGAARDPSPQAITARIDAKTIKNISFVREVWQDGSTIKKTLVGSRDGTYWLFHGNIAQVLGAIAFAHDTPDVQTNLPAIKITDADLQIYRTEGVPGRFSCTFAEPRLEFYFNNATDQNNKSDILNIVQVGILTTQAATPDSMSINASVEHLVIYVRQPEKDAFMKLMIEPGLSIPELAQRISTGLGTTPVWLLEKDIPFNDIPLTRPLRRAAPAAVPAGA